MGVLRCKICGGNLPVVQNTQVVRCEFCETEQTITTIEDERIQNMYNRANALRMRAEFDKAEEVYEQIVQTEKNDAEAYWGIILCRYGIEYVEDPVTSQHVPTCNRASFESIVASEEYKKAIELADSIQKDYYQKEATIIDDIQKHIIEISNQEEPYDVFICYKAKEGDNRTLDSSLANEIYYELEDEGIKTFFAEITLESKLGEKYEPYIFSALNSAKVMLAIGTKPEFYQSPWVKNEWSRFLKIMNKDRTKLLIPCFRNMDAYDLPEEFSHLQAQDMGKIGFITDLIRGIKKVIGRKKSETSTTAKELSQYIIANSADNHRTDALLDRGYMALEDSEWDNAERFFEEVLNSDAKCSKAYLGKFLCRNQYCSMKHFENEYLELSVFNEGYRYVYIDKKYKDYVNKKIKDNSFSGYFDENELRELYNYTGEVKYESNAEYLKTRLMEFRNTIAEDKDLQKAKKYATDEEEKQISDLVKKIEQEYSLHISRQDECDQERARELKENLNCFWKQRDEQYKMKFEEVKQRRNREKQRRNREYNTTIQNIINSSSVVELNKILSTTCVQFKKKKEFKEIVERTKKILDSKKKIEILKCEMDNIGKENTLISVIVSTVLGTIIGVICFLFIQLFLINFIEACLPIPFIFVFILVMVLDFYVSDKKSVKKEKQRFFEEKISPLEKNIDELLKENEKYKEHQSEME